MLTTAFKKILDHLEFHYPSQAPPPHISRHRKSPNNSPLPRPDTTFHTKLPTSQTTTTKPPRYSLIPLSRHPPLQYTIHTRNPVLVRRGHRSCSSCPIYPALRTRCRSIASMQGGLFEGNVDGMRFTSLSPPSLSGTSSIITPSPSFFLLETLISPFLYFPVHTYRLLPSPKIQLSVKGFRQHQAEPQYNA